MVGFGGVTVLGGSCWRRYAASVAAAATIGIGLMIKR